MILKDVEEKLREKIKDGFLYPDYNHYCISNIPATIFHIFGLKFEGKVLKEFLPGKDFEKVVLFLVDGFGYSEFLKHRNVGLLKRIVKKGVVVPITTVFPSSTAPALTTLATGLTPQQHGLIEWFMYMKELDQIIKTLSFSPLRSDVQDELSKILNPRILFRGASIHQKLRREGIKSLVFNFKRYVKSCYSSIAYKGSVPVSYITSSDLSVKLRKLVEREDGYFYVHWPFVDWLKHYHGKNSEITEAETLLLFHQLRQHFFKKIDRKVARKTLFIMVSDHGLVDVDKREVVFLNKYSSILKNLKKSKKEGYHLVSGGSRSVFLHVRRGKVEETKELLERKIQTDKKVVECEKAVKEGLFGKGRPTKKFLERVGDLLVLPKKSGVWYKYYKGFDIKFQSVHGGLTQEEMLVPLAMVRVSDVI